MGDRFSFRLPWLAPERPAAQPQRRRPSAETSQSPWRPRGAAPNQQSGSRSARVAPAQPPRQQPRLPPKADPQSPSPTSSTAAAENPKTSTSSTISKPPSPSTTTAKSSQPSQAATESTKTTSKPTSSPPSRATTESLKSTTPSSSKQPPTTPVTAKLASPSSTANESPKPTSKSPPAQLSPSHAAAESRTSSQPASPSTQTRTQTRAASVSSSPPKGDSKSKASSTPPSPSRSSSEAQPKPRKSPQPQSSGPAAPKTTTSEGSPSRKATQKEPEAAPSIAPQSPSSAQAESSTAQEEPKKATSKEPLQEPKSKVELKSVTMKIPSSKDDATARGTTDVSSPGKSVPASKEVMVEPKQPQKLDSSIIRDDLKPLAGESKETEGIKGRIQELPKEEKNQQATTYEEPVQKTITETPSSKRDSRDIHVGEFQETKRQQKLEASTRKETFATTSYIGKQIKTAIPSQTGSNTSMSFQKPAGGSTKRPKEIQEDISMLVRKLATETQFDENQVTVITLTGENRGASMQLSSEQVKRETPIHIHRGYKTDPDDSGEVTTDGEALNNRKKFDDQMAPQPKAYVNSNAQGVNNSICVEASLGERNPGVHLLLSQYTSDAIKSDGTSGFIQTRKAECTTTTSERLTHEPTVRRRCLRGLLMESSDSDLDNPIKPRRHGCRYSCGQKNKDKEFM